MRICIISNPNSIFIKRWAEFYASNNHEVHIIHVDSIKNISKKVSVPGAKIHRIFFLTFILLNLQTILNLIQLLWILKKVKPDILHAHILTYPSYLAVLTGFHPIIASAWGSDIYIEAKTQKENRFWVLTTLEKADLITTTSKTLKRHIIDNFNVPSKKVTRFYWGQDLKTFKRGYEKEVQEFRKKYGLRSDTFVVLSSRNMKPSYYIRDIIKCIPDVLKKRKNVKFIFLRGYSIDEYVIELKKLISELKLEKHVIFIDEFLDPGDLAAVNNLADVVISLPSSDQLSGSIKEAMACGAIPISQDLEVYHELIEDGKNGFL
jgi:glycosyltransferase involved in cell wall biosynthesis